MSSNFTIDQLTESETLDPNSIYRIYKLNIMCKFMENKSNNPKLTQKEISKQLGFSDNTIKQYRDEIHMKSPYNRSNYKKRATKQKPNTITGDQSKNQSSKSITNKKSKNIDLKGGDPTNVYMSGKELIEQAFPKEHKRVIS